MTKRILSYVLFGFGFLIILFFRGYKGNIIPYPFVFYLLGFSCFIIGIILLRKLPTKKEAIDNKRLNDEIQKLILSGEKIIIDLSKCLIKENNYTEEVEKYSPDNYLTSFDIERNIQVVNVLFGKSIDNVDKVRVNQTVLIYEAEIDGIETKFTSRILPIDRINLLFKIDKKKETILYLDKNNLSKYYFDLDFIES